MNRPILVALIAVGIPACTVGPDYERPPTPPMEAFRELNPPGASIADLHWWDLFQDSTLHELIGTALENNRDLRAALARIAEARAVLGFTRADLYPRIDYFAGAGAAASTSGGEDGGETNVSVSGGISVFWEIDLWGKFRRSNEAALNELLATEESFRGVTITLVADVAIAYLQLRDLDNRLVISESTVQARREALEINQARFDAGAIAGVDVAQAEVQLAGAEAVVQSLLRARAQTEHAIALLLGSPPRTIPRGRRLQEQLFPPEIPAGLPSELLERRPDILVAERQLHAQTARIGVAEALKLPALSLTADAGVKSDELTAMTLTTGLFNVAANLFGPLFNAGKNQRRVEIEQARTEQLLNTYEQTILNAFREVEDALVAVQTYRDEYAIRRRQVGAAQEALDLSNARYDGGWTSYLEVIIQQRSLFDAQLSASETLQLQLASIVDLYRALGGGWSIGPTVTESD
ncbi:MAG: efflux transporter outer membrane subunit [Gemmatimonadota bacterium]|nr:MAG: efflux transporter outer membrane subunit [Gemmatimonadota bacterium]